MVGSFQPGPLLSSSSWPPLSPSRSRSLAAPPLSPPGAGGLSGLPPRSPIPPSRGAMSPSTSRQMPQDRHAPNVADEFAVDPAPTGLFPLPGWSNSNNRPGSSNTHRQHPTAAFIKRGDFVHPAAVLPTGERLQTSASGLQASSSSDRMVSLLSDQASGMTLNGGSKRSFVDGAQSYQSPRHKGMMPR